MMKRKLKIVSLLILLGGIMINPIKSFGQDDKVYGIGVMFRLDTAYDLLPVISKVIENSTAEAVGLKEGWHLLMANGVNLKGKNQREVMNLIRGVDGTYVKLLIGKSKNPKDNEEFIVRRRQLPTKQ
jgi:C-terminal processing protease CtpA/Prc